MRGQLVDVDVTSHQGERDGRLADGHDLGHVHGFSAVAELICAVSLRCGIHGGLAEQTAFDQRVHAVLEHRDGHGRGQSSVSMQRLQHMAEGVGRLLVHERELVQQGDLSRAVRLRHDQLLAVRLHLEGFLHELVHLALYGFVHAVERDAEGVDGFLRNVRRQAIWVCHLFYRLFLAVQQHFLGCLLH